MTEPRPDIAPFSMLLRIAGDEDQMEIWSARTSIQGWLAFERALALAQADEGEMTTDDAACIVAAARLDTIDEKVLWETARTVGYPILGLVRQIAGALPPGPAGRVHFGATTQDVMDTALALQMACAMDRIDTGIVDLGNALSDQIEAHRLTVMAARTHGQQAVPTTFGATLAGLLGQLTRHRSRIASARPHLEVVSLYGAGGTGAALGPGVAKVRRRVAERLGLGFSDVPWHVERDAPAEFGWLCATIAGGCAKLARNVIDLSRTEVGEVNERFSDHRGASSTMPQKINPISSEIVVGLSATASALTSALTRFQEAGHERSAGEWQIEWHVLPQLAVLAGSALAESVDLVRGLRVNTERMRQNLQLDGGLVLAESLMMQLAPALGQTGAHDLVYQAAQRARRDRLHLVEAVAATAREQGLALGDLPFSADDYLGEAAQICRTAVDSWRGLAGPAPARPALSSLALA
ncbi:lyase family protein [Mycobacterium sp. 21AC1]|uniref:lyase family protein n=1 Tax=[Mycobacterium] appelbergii TaxID=2939269 RepID=UPI0029394C9D|nr:lyase family protein [Mycobacterium sp. 21AC1]MDV3126142.1 lyase family protein [Mycobacterium sp. 21AC1]